MNTQILTMATLGVVAAGVGWVLSPKRASAPRGVRAVAVNVVGTLAVLAVAYHLFARWQAQKLVPVGGESEALMWGLAAGFLLVLAAHAVGWKREANAAVSLGLAGAAAALLGTFATEEGGRALAAAAVAAGVSSVALRGSTELRTALLFLFAALSGIMAREAAPYSPTWQVGAMFALAGAVGACVQAALASRAHRLAALAAGFGVAIGIGALGAFRYLYVGDLFTLLVAGMAVAVGVFLVGEEDSSPPNGMRLLLCVLIVLGAGAWAFSLRHGFGMSALLVSAGVFATLLGSNRALASLSPPLSLVLLRVLIEWAGGGSAVDLGQHYVLMGFAAGALLPLAVTQWDGRLSAEWASTLWQVLVVGVPALAALFLALTGAAGFLLGLMISPIAAVLLGAREKEATDGIEGVRAALLCGCAGLIVIFTTIVTPEGLVSRSAKVNALLWALGAIVVISALLVMGTRGRVSAGSGGPQ
ncbi:MAG: hypothetical protein C4341_01320 [Armatimonadota bacterium]